MKKIVSALIALLATMFLVGCGGATLTPKQQSLVDNKTELYTQTSMWIEKNRVYGTNFAKGLHIPVNSKVKITSMTAKVIIFEYLGTEVRYEVYTKHTKIDAGQTLDRLFGVKKVNLSKFSKSTQTNILAGKVVKGMSKEAVLIARGYPPMHATFSLEGDLWKYWYHRFKTSSITFKNNKVVRLQGGVV